MQRALNEVGVLENVAVGMQLGRLEASDPEGGVVTYSSSSSVVNVAAATGIVTLAQALNYEVWTQHNIVQEQISKAV